MWLCKCIIHSLLITFENFENSRSNFDSWTKIKNNNTRNFCKKVLFLKVATAKKETLAIQNLELVMQPTPAMTPKMSTRLTTFLSPANKLQLKEKGQLKRSMCLSLVIGETTENWGKQKCNLQAFEVDSSLKAVVFKCILHVQQQ